MDQTETVRALQVVVEEARSPAERLEELRKLLPSLPTATIVAGYARLHPLLKAVEEFKKAVREELVGDGESGRAFRPDEGVEVEVSESGSRTLTADGVSVRLQKSVTYVPDEEAARVILEPKGLWEEATVRVFEIVDQEAFSRAWDALLAVDPDVLYVRSELAQAVQERRSLDEGKVDALLVLGRITADEAAAMFRPKVSWALTVPGTARRRKKVT